MINDNSTGYWDFSNEIAPQWMDYGSPGAAPKTGSITVGGGGNAAPVGVGGAPIGGANPIFSVGPPNPNTNTNPNPSQFTPNPFMTPGMTFQPQTQFGQQASAPLNLSQQGRTYGQMLGGPNMAQQLPAFQSMHPGGSSGFMPQFQNPYGPQAQPQQYTPMGQPPTQISQQPTQLPFTPVMRPPRLQPANDGLAALMASQMQRPS